MRQKNKNPEPGHKLPSPIIERRRWPIPLIWLVPLGAAIAAGFYYYDAMQDRGPLITITFNDIGGLKSDNTPIERNGVQIGQVTWSELAPDKRHVLIHARLQRVQTAFAEKGAMFWIMRPELSGGSLSGLNTVVSGSYIEAVPGSGEATTDFNGYDKPPVTLGGGLEVTLYADRLEHLQPNSPVYYRGIQVGAVEDIQLSDDSTRVRFRVFIQKRYSPLVRPGSQFWQLAGADLKGGLFSGLKLEIGPLRALLAGGIEFATPDVKGAAMVKEGAEFALNEEPKKEWTSWAPQIPLLPGDEEQAPKDNTTQETKKALQSVSHEQ